MNREQLIGDLEALGLAGQDLLVHSSYKSLGGVEGGPDVVVDALLQVGNNVLFPAHTWALALEDGPIRFDVRDTPVMRIGIIPEMARRRSDSQRSLHATHSVTAFGPDAAWFVADHEKAPSPCGPGSPYYKLGDRGGKIMLLGCDHESNTCMHQIEEVLKLPLSLEEEPLDAVLIDAKGEEHHVKSVMHSFIPRRFERFDEVFTRLGIQYIGKVGPATVRVVDAMKMRQFLLQACTADPQALCREEPYQ